MFLSLGLFVLTFLVYIQGVSPSVYGGDSGDIITSAWFGGIAHAPGYPLNAMIGWIFTHLPYNAPVAYKADVMAAFFVATTVVLLFLTTQKLIKNIYIALASSLIFAFNPLVWLYAHIIEVFQLNLLLVAASFYFLVSWRESILVKKSKGRFLYLSILFWGLAVFHHQTSLLIAPAYFYLILKTQKVSKERVSVLKLIFCFSLGFIPNFYLIFASFKNVPTNWVTIRTISDFAKLISRADYGTFVASGFLLGADLKSRFLEILYFFLLSKSDFQIISSFLILVGVIFTFFKEKTFFWLFFLGVFFTGPFFLFYAAFPIGNDFYQGLWERFVLLSYFFLSFYIAFGFKFLIIIINKYLIPLITQKKIQKLLMICFLAIFFTIPLSMFNTNFNKADMSKFILGNSLGHDFLFSADDNAIIFLLGDTITFNTEYVYYTNFSDSHVRSIKLIRGGSLSDLNYRKRVAKVYPMLKFPEAYFENVKKEGMYFITLLAVENKRSFPVYIIELPPPIENYRWMEVGLLQKLVAEKEYTADMLLRENRLKTDHFDYTADAINDTYTQFMVSDIQRIYFLALIKLSDELISVNRFDEAVKYLNWAIKLDSNKKEPYLRLGNIYSENGKCSDALLYYSKAQELDNKDWNILLAFSKVYKNCLNDEGLSKKYQDEAEYLRLKITDKPLKNF